MKIKKVLIGVLSVLLFMTACNNLSVITPSENEGSLYISLGENVSRSLLPNVSMDIARYTIIGSGPDGAGFTETTTGTFIEIEGLAFGTWTIEVYGENEDGFGIGSGCGTTAVHTGEISEVTVVVKPYDGFGSLNLAVNWTAGDIEIPTIDATLIPSTGLEVFPAFTINDNSAVFSTDSAATGYYTLSLKLMDNNISTIGTVEIVRIVKDALTEGVFDFYEINKPGGTIDVNITQEMGDPIEVFINGVIPVLHENGSMEVSATAPEESENLLYVWYLNGESFTTGDTTVISGLSAGIYNLNVTAFTADGMRAGSTGETFHITDVVENYSLSGIISDGVSPVADVVLTLSGDQLYTATSDSNGSYSFDDIPGGDYTLTPDSNGLIFNPSESALSLYSNMSGVNFTTLDISAFTQIHDVQGASHTSPLSGSAITDLIGVVTAKDGKGFWMQSPVADSDIATSEGMLVYMNSAPAVEVGDLVLVDGTVKEHGYNADLKITEITYPTITATLQTGYPLPAPVILGNGGRILPNSIICNDATGDVYTSVFDPEEDGIDFYESIENMLVQINDAVVVGGDKYGEVPVLADNGANALAERITDRGGVSIIETNYNPNRILIDTDSYILGLSAMVANTGDRFNGPVQGVVGYSYGKFIVLPTVLPELISGNLMREESLITGSESRLTVAAFNMENYPRDDEDMTSAEIQEKVADMAQTIVSGLNSPDIIAIAEMTDDSYSENNGVVTAAANYGELISAISAAGGPGQYDFREIAPLNNSEGGWPGANIRVGFLFNSARVTFEDIGNGDAVTDTQVVNNGGVADINLSPGRISVDSFAGSRRPLIGKFNFNGENIFVIANHFNSKGGDNALYGANQPPILGSEPERMTQAAAINDFVDSILAVQSDAKIIVAGDLNDFQFSNPLETLKGGVLYNLTEELIDETEQYSYIYNGNSQQLDHILVSSGLFSAEPYVDIVHRYSEYSSQERHTDHDPILSSFYIENNGDSSAPAWMSGYPSLINIGETAAELVFMTNEDASVFYSVLADGSPAPTSEELKSANTTAVSAGLELAVGLTGLTLDTQYDIYVAAEDALGNLSSAPVLVELLTAGGAPPSGLTGLFFSDYGEGASNNKFLEIFNSGTEEIILQTADGISNVFMILASNSNTLSTGSVNNFPNGTSLIPGLVYGAYHGSAVDVIKDKLDGASSFASGATNFNGNDAIALVQDIDHSGTYDAGIDIILDIIGVPGDSAYFAQNMGMMRNADIDTGSSVFDLSQWTAYSQADVDAATNYGVHP